MKTRFFMLFSIIYITVCAADLAFLTTRYIGKSCDKFTVAGSLGVARVTKSGCQRIELGANTKGYIYGYVNVADTSLCPTGTPVYQDSACTVLLQDYGLVDACINTTTPTTTTHLPSNITTPFVPESSQLKSRLTKCEFQPPVNGPPSVGNTIKVIKAYYTNTSDCSPDFIDENFYEVREFSSTDCVDNSIVGRFGPAGVRYPSDCCGDIIYYDDKNCTKESSKYSRRPLSAWGEFKVCKPRAINARHRSMMMTCIDGKSTECTTTKAATTTVSMSTLSTSQGSPFSSKIAIAFFVGALFFCNIV